MKLINGLELMEMGRTYGRLMDSIDTAKLLLQARFAIESEYFALEFVNDDGCDGSKCVRLWGKEQGHRQPIFMFDSNRLTDLADLAVCAEIERIAKGKTA